MANQEKRNTKMQQIVAKCWSDEAFNEKLVAAPPTTAKEWVVSSD